MLEEDGDGGEGEGGEGGLSLEERRGGVTKVSWKPASARIHLSFGGRFVMKLRVRVRVTGKSATFNFF